MHKSSMLRMEWFVNNFVQKMSLNEINVLDIGSCGTPWKNVDGSGNYKHLFTDKKFKYVGLDMTAGPNVDICVNTPYYWSALQDSQFDVVISGQAFEHMEFFWLTLEEISRVLKPTGLLCIIAPRFWERHRAPIDTYRFDQDGMVALARYINFIPLHASMNLAPINAPEEWYNDRGGDAFLIAKKPDHWDGKIKKETYHFKPIENEQFSSGFIAKPTTHVTRETRKSKVQNFIKRLNKHFSRTRTAKTMEDQKF